MQDNLNDISTYPELENWTLINLYTNEEHIVNESMLIEAFPDELELMKIKSGRSRAWLLLENNTPTNAIQKLY